MASVLFPLLILNGPPDGLLYDPVGRSLPLIGGVAAALCWRLVRRWRRT